MTDELESLLRHAAAARREYLEHFVRTLADLRRAGTAHTELLVRPRARTNRDPFGLGRVDVLVGDARAPELHRIAARFTHVPFSIDALETWYGQWLDVAETNVPDADGLLGVVHDLAWRTDGIGAREVVVDLGSAPLDALTTLLQILASAGVRHCVVDRGDRGVA
jgi:hypothetical protein